MSKLPIFSYLFLLLLLSCNEPLEKEISLELNEKYNNIRAINAIANCEGPNGKYVSEMQSFEDGSCIFYQDFEYRDAAFYAQITANNQGFVLDSLGTPVDTLSKEVIEIVRSHEFHRLQIDPQHFFSSISFSEKIKDGIIAFSAEDRLNNPVKLTYNEREQLILKIDMVNPLDTAESIEIFNTHWAESEYGKLVQKVKIVQAQKDTFTFDYHSIELNKNKIN
ncbi:MAG: hypothetical protein AAFO07_11115 [Bacteroidota bacterium]